MRLTPLCPASCLILASAILAGSCRTVPPTADGQIASALTGLRSADPAVRGAVLLGLKQRSDPEWALALVRALRSASESERAALFDALHECRTPVKIAPLLSWLHESHDALWVYSPNVAWQIADLGDAAVDPLLAVMGECASEDALAPIPTWAATTLVRAGPQGMASLVAAATHQRPCVRREAIKGLKHALQECTIGDDATGAQAQQALATALADEAAGVRSAAISALSELTSDARFMEQCAASWDASLTTLRATVRRARNSAVRAEAVRLLGILAGQAAVTELGAATVDTDPEVRAAAKAALVDLRRAARMASPARLLLSADAAQRLAGIQAISESDRQADAPRLVPLLKDADETVRAQAVSVLGRFVEQSIVSYDLARALVHPVSDALDDSSPIVRASAVASLNAICGTCSCCDNRQTATRLLPLLGDPDSNVVAAAEAALSRSGDPALVPSLLASLDSPDRDLMKAAIRVLGSVGNERSVQALLPLTNDPDADIRRSALRSLAYLSPHFPDPRAVAALRMALSDPGTAASAIEALGNLKDRQAVPALVGLLPEREHFSRVCTALGEIGDPAAVVPLLAHAQDATATARLSVAWALAHLKDRRALAALERLLKDEDRSVRLAAASALDAIADRSAVPILLSALTDEDSMVQGAVAKALGHMREPRAVEPLIALLPHNAFAVVEPLGQIGDPRAVESLVRLLEQQHRTDRAQIAHALGVIRDPRAIESLAVAIGEANDSYLQREAIWALGEIRDRRAAEPLKRLRQQATVDAFLRAAIDKALSQIETAP